MEDGRAAECYIERRGQRSVVGQVWKGRVENVLAGMEAAFVEIGLEKNGFLFVDEIVVPELEGNRHGKKITDLIQRGQQILVQAVKDPMKTKGARLTTEISLPGRFLVYVPNGEGLGVSRRLEDSERARLKDILKEIAPPTGGVIVEGTAEALAAQWRAACRRDRIALVIAAPSDDRGWSSDDMEYLVQLVPAAMRRAGADPRRVVVAGEGKAGQLAYALAMAARKWVRGVAAIDSPLPRTLKLPQNSPNERLAVLSVETQDAPLSVLIRRDASKLAEAGYPTSRIERRADRQGDELDAVTRGKLVRWVDGLDRF